MEELQIETTVYSMSAEPPPDVNRRADDRHLTLFRVGCIVVDGHRELCLVKNISAGGALLRAYCTLEPDLAVTVELKERQPISGRVSWVRGSDAGISFDEPVDVVELLKASSDGPRPRMPRIEVDSLAFVREGAILHRTKVINVSQGGLSVQSHNPLAMAAEVTVTLPGLAPQGAVVRWKDGDKFGITFNTVLPLAGLVEWLRARRGA
ncbi:MAG TPA: PilZ domain-containing protein [Sphingomicrobium sp.]|nr:PilZ domain-containing protein [Sphingomicrobium sp.]